MAWFERVAGAWLEKQIEKGKKRKVKMSFRVLGKNVSNRELAFNFNYAALFGYALIAATAVANHNAGLGELVLLIFLRVIPITVLFFCFLVLTGFHRSKYGIKN